MGCCASYLTTGHTTTTWVLTVLSNTSMTGGDVTAVLPRLGESGRHGGGCCLLLSASGMQRARRGSSSTRMGCVFFAYGRIWLSATYFCVLE
jgi:hypothetical protein